MKSSNISSTLTLLIVVAFATSLTAQSRTEEARDRMKGESDDSSISFAFTLIELSIDVLPEFFYFRPIFLNEPIIRYTPYPYSGAGLGRGIRSFNPEGAGRGNLLEMRLNLSLPQGSMAMEQRSAELKWHTGYWLMNSQFDYFKELGAPWGIYQFNLMGGRKFRFFTSGDAGFSMGYRNVMIGGDRFDGLEAAVHADLYPVKPVSISYYSGIMPHTYGDITNTRLSVGIHRGPVRFSVGHHWLNIANIPFNTFSAGFNVYL